MALDLTVRQLTLVKVLLAAQSVPRAVLELAASLPATTATVPVHQQLLDRQDLPDDLLDRVCATVATTTRLQAAAVAAATFRALDRGADPRAVVADLEQMLLRGDDPAGLVQLYLDRSADPAYQQMRSLLTAATSGRPLYEITAAAARNHYWDVVEAALLRWDDLLEADPASSVTAVQAAAAGGSAMVEWAAAQPDVVARVLGSVRSDALAQAWLSAAAHLGGDLADIAARRVLVPFLRGPGRRPTEADTAEHVVARSRESWSAETCDLLLEACASSNLRLARSRAAAATIDSAARGRLWDIGRGAPVPTSTPLDWLDAGQKEAAGTWLVEQLSTLPGPSWVALVQLADNLQDRVTLGEVLTVAEGVTAG